MSVLSQAKYYYDKFYIDGEWDDSAGITWMGKNYTPEKLVFFKRFFACLTSDKFMNKGTEIYMKDAQSSIRASIRKWNMAHPEDQIIESNGLTHYKYCSKKLKGIFDDEEMLSKIMISTTGIDKKYLRQLNDFIEKYGMKQVADKEMIIRLPHYTKMSDVTDEEFIALLRLIEPYSKQYIKMVQQQVNKKRDEVGYLNYIMIPNIELSEKDQYRKGMVEAMLGHSEMTLDEYLNKDKEPVDIQTEESEPDYTELDKELKESFDKQVQQLIESRKSMEVKIVPEGDLDFDFDLADDGDIIDLGETADLDMRNMTDEDTEVKEVPKVQDEKQKVMNDAALKTTRVQF